jgi:hypothetical protein
MNQSFVIDHTIVISDFDPGTIYRIRAQSTGGSDEVAVSEDYSLLTPHSQENIIDVIIDNVEDTFGFTRR